MILIPTTALEPCPGSIPEMPLPSSHIDGSSIPRPEPSGCDPIDVPDPRPPNPLLPAIAKGSSSRVFPIEVGASLGPIPCIARLRDALE